MILASIFLQFLLSSAQAEVTKENFVTIGYHKKETISLREHKVKNGTGYSITRNFDGSKITGHKLSSKKYVELKTELENFLSSAKKIPVVELVDCSDPLVMGNKLKSKTSDLTGVCLRQESLNKRKAFARWWVKASKNL